MSIAAVQSFSCLHMLCSVQLCNLLCGVRFFVLLWYILFQLRVCSLLQDSFVFLYYKILNCSKHLTIISLPLVAVWGLTDQSELSKSVQSLVALGKFDSIPPSEIVTTKAKPAQTQAQTKQTQQQQPLAVVSSRAKPATRFSDQSPQREAEDQEEENEQEEEAEQEGYTEREAEREREEEGESGVVRGSVEGTSPPKQGKTLENLTDDELAISYRLQPLVRSSRVKPLYSSSSISLPSSPSYAQQQQYSGGAKKALSPRELLSSRGVAEERPIAPPETQVSADWLIEFKIIIDDLIYDEH